MHPSEIRDQLRNFYNSSAQSFSLSRKNYWIEFELIKEYFPVSGKLLDYGCGNGRLARFLSECQSSLQYQGVDISTELIKFAQNDNPGKNFSVLAKENKLPFANNEFEIVCSVAVFHHFNPEMLAGALKEISRVLKKDGILVCLVWRLWNWKYLKYFLVNFFSMKGRWALIPFGDKRLNQKRFCYLWTGMDLKRIFSKTGFKIIKKSAISRLKGNGANYFFVLKNF